jgi:uncharacterized protein
MKLDQKYFELIRNYLKDKPVKKAYLFGSFSSGNEMPESDIDILVDLDYTNPIGLEFVQMQLDLEKILNKKVDLVSSNGLSKHIQPYIDKEKVLIYAR